MSSNKTGEWLPNICPSGHRLSHPNVLVSWRPCACYPGRDGHRTVTCLICGLVWFRPPHADDGKSTAAWH